MIPSFEQGRSSAPAAGLTRRAQARRTTSAGFTLIELTVALLAGLIVAMGIVTLSREATNTFHEEARSSAAEAALRTAIDRLRADIERAGYMSTGNIVADPRIAHALGQASNVALGTPAGIAALSSVAWTPGGSYTSNTLTLSDVQPTPLRPDVLQIAGNMTSADAFNVASISTTALAGCTRIYLAPGTTSPATYRVIGANPTNTTVKELRNVFFPSTAPSGSVQFIVRLVDANQCVQFLATCPNSADVAGLDSNAPYVDVATNPALVTASGAGTVCGVSGYGEGSKVNPVQVVRWEITTQGSPGDPEPLQYVAGLGNPTTATGKYDLMRSYLDITGKVVPDTSELVAEYAVDLAFAFSVDQGIATAPNIVTFSFEDQADNSKWTPPTLTAAGNPGPQRIRSVRVRLATRTALPDRSVNIAPTALGAQIFTYRYCALAAGCTASTTGALQWARTRTITTEVSLPNQAEDFY